MYSEIASLFKSFVSKLDVRIATIELQALRLDMVNIKHEQVISKMFQANARLPLSSTICT